MAVDNTIWATVTDPGCSPCLDDIIAAGPDDGNMNSKAFAEYLCAGKGGSEVALCIPECGSTTADSDDPMDLVYASQQSGMIMTSWFAYCVDYYPEEMCEGFKGQDYADEVCTELGASSHGGSGASSSSSSGSGSDSTSSESSDTTTSPEGGSTGKTQPTTTAAAGGGQQSQKTSTPSSGAAAVAIGGVSVALWETSLVGLVALLVNI
ncbi:hypothetical protein OQA88_3272 [Cercophora sp. LCS_1]